MFIKTHAILDAFCEMDIQKLDQLLNDHQTYQEANKSTFLKKLHLVFSQMSSGNAERLELHGGKCGSAECNYGCRGYMFKSPFNGKNVSFIFEETKDGDDFNDIYTCYQFKTNKDVLDMSKSIFLDIGNDEKANFHPSESYLEKMEKCQSAIAEITNGWNEEIVITKEEIFDWLEKYRPVFSSFDIIPLFYDTFKTFYLLYSNIDKLGNYLIHDDLAAAAITEINLDAPNDEKQLLEWLMKYEKLGSELSLFLDEYYNEPNPSPIPKYISPDWTHKHIKVESQEFISILEFVPFFNENYDRMRLEFGSDPAEI